MPVICARQVDSLAVKGLLQAQEEDNMAVGW